MVMWSAFRTTFLCLRTVTASLSLNSSSTTLTRRTTRCSHFFTSIAGCDSVPAVEKQLNEFQHRLDECESIRDHIADVVMDIETTRRLAYTGILNGLQFRPIPEVLEEAKSDIDGLKQLLTRLAIIVRESPVQSYRYHGDWRTEGYNGDWRTEAQQTLGVLGFIHWLETGNLLLYKEIEENLGLNALESGIDVEDYIVGLCFMSNKLATYVVDQVYHSRCLVSASYYDFRKVFEFVENLNRSLRSLVLKNDFLCRKLDGMDDDLTKIMEACLRFKSGYYMKFRELTSEDDLKEDQT